ncbi:MAG: PLP-dependent transferase [Cyclobacteriaceae bacterium]|nr:PLP-dependent transferase [Cyclobacteriaceae bacterium]MCK5210185.1 PLP-dependent transferase [Cyclobacteriaceae bacterium]
MDTKSKPTICVHEGQKPDEYSGINTPIFTSTSYGYLDSEERIYPRYFNIPNQKVLINKLSKLENAESGLIFSSGMAAISTTLLSLLNNGNHIIFQKGLYGGTINFILEDFNRFGINYTMLTSNDSKSIYNSIKENTKIIYIETPSNPLLTIIDLKEISDVCKSNNILSIIDNTFASPINQNPIDFGIDIVLHSATKYLGGHSDISAGAVLSRQDLIDKIIATSLNLGGSLNAIMCHLLERSLKTLAIRVDKQNDNAQKLAEWLNNNSNVIKVYYPGLVEHNGHEIAKKQMTGFGGMLSFEINEPNVYNFQKKLDLIKPSMSLGGVESTICAPSLTSHRHLTNEQKEKDGINDYLLRLSVGIEDVNDLILDLERAMEK